MWHINDSKIARRNPSGEKILFVWWNRQETFCGGVTQENIYILQGPVKVLPLQQSLSCKLESYLLCFQLCILSISGSFLHSVMHNLVELFQVLINCLLNKLLEGQVLCLIFTFIIIALLSLACEKPLRGSLN